MKELKKNENRIANGLSGANCCDGRTYHHWADTGDDPYNASTSKYYSDPKQGCIEDCWFIAALVSVAWVANSNLNTHPNYKFYDVKNKVWGPSFSINNELPVDANGNLVYARTNSGYIWPCLYEKAYAVWKANNPQPVYENYLKGGTGAYGLQTIAGGTLGPKNTMPPFDGLKKTKYPTVATTIDGAGAGLTSMHDYSVLKKPSTTTYQLRDPCTCSIFTISTTDFTNNFKEWYYVIPP